MNMRYFKAISMLLAFMLIFLTLSSTVFAIPTEGFLEKLKAMDASVTLDGENPGTATVAVFATEAISVYGLEGVWDTTEQEGTNKLTLSKVESDVITFSDMNYADAPSGKVLWTDDTFSNPAVLENETKLITATYTVPADTPEGTYTVRFLSQVFTADNYTPDENEMYFTAKITVSKKAVESGLYLNKLTPVNGSVVLDGENPSTVTVSLAGTDDMNVYGFEGVWDTTEQEGTNKLTLSKIESDIITFDGMNYADVATGKVLWTDDTFSNPAVLENETKLLTATYTVPADTPAGTYTVRFLSQVFTADDYNPDETVKYFTATITVTVNTTVDTETDSEIDTDTESDMETDSEINTDTDTDKINIMLGDVTGDGQVRMDDVVEIQKAIAKLIELNSDQLVAADVNMDGFVTMDDVVTIQRYIAKLITTLAPTADIIYYGGEGKSLYGDSTEYLKKYEVGSAVLIRSNFFVNDGFAFIGWNTEKDGSGTAYNVGQWIKMPKEGLKLYAQWGSVAYTITYNANADLGEGVQTVIKMAYGPDQIATILAEFLPVREKYVFRGWSLTPNGNPEYLEGDLYIDKKDITLYAVWSRIDGV